MRTFLKSSHHPRPPLLSVLIALAAAAIAGHALIMLLMARQVLDGALVGDWLPFYMAGHMVRLGDASRLYLVSAQAATEHALFGDVSVNNFPLPAFAAVGFAPLSLLSFAQSYFVWLGVNTAIVALLAAVAWRSLGALDRSARAWFIACGVASTPMLRLLSGAQVDLLVVAGLAGCFALLRKGRPATAGVVLALGLVKPHFLLAAVLLLLLHRQTRALLGFGAAGALLLGAPVALTGFGAWRDQAALLMSYPTSSLDSGVAAEHMVNLRGLIVSTMGPDHTLLWVALLASAATLALWPAQRVWRGRPAADAQSWALAAVLPLIYSPHVHMYSMVLLLLAGGLLLLARAEAGASVDTAAILAASLALTVVSFFAMFVVAAASIPIMITYALLATRWRTLAGAAAPESAVADDVARAAVAQQHVEVRLGHLRHASTVPERIAAR